MLLLPQDIPFLQGRVFVFASQFVSALPESSAGDFMRQAQEALDRPDTPVAVKLSAVRAIAK